MCSILQTEGLAGGWDGRILKHPEGIITNKSVRAPAITVLMGFVDRYLLSGGKGSCTLINTSHLWSRKP